MPISNAKKAANARYNAKCGRIELRPIAEEADQIRAAAATAGKSLQGYILDAVREKMEKENAEK